MKKLNVMGVVAVMSAALIGCGGDEPAVEAAPSPVSAPATSAAAPEKPAAAEPKKEESAFNHFAKDPGQVGTSEYVDASFADVLYNYYQISGERSPISEWTRFDSAGSELGDSFRALVDHSYTWGRNEGSFATRDAEQSWNDGWDGAIAEGKPAQRFYKDVYLHGGPSDIISQYDFDTQSFHLQPAGGVNVGAEIKAMSTFDDNFGYTFIGLPESFKVTDETLARKIEELRSSSSLMLKVHGGVHAVTKVERRFVDLNLMIVNFHFADLIDRRTGEVIHTF